jgi:hypothetical protein
MCTFCNSLLGVKFAIIDHILLSEWTCSFKLCRCWLWILCFKCVGYGFA